MNKKIIFGLFFLILINLTAFSARIVFPKSNYPFYAVSENRDVVQFTLSPDMTALSSGVSEKKSGGFFLLNPASPSDIDLLYFQASLGFMPGFYEKSYNNTIDLFSTFFINTVFNISVEKIGVFSGAVQFIDSSNNSREVNNFDKTALDKLTSFYFNYARSFDYGFSFGSSLKYQMSYRITNSADESREFDFAVLADFGFQHIPVIEYKTVNNFGFQDFSWGVSLSNAGAVVDNSESKKSLYDFPLLFTPAAGAGFNVYNNGDYHVRFTADLIFPFVSNFKVHISSEIKLFNILHLYAGYRFDLIETLEKKSALTVKGSHGDLPPVSMGGSLRFEIKEKNNLSIDIGVKPVDKGFQVSGGITVGYFHREPAKSRGD